MAQSDEEIVEETIRSFEQLRIRRVNHDRMNDEIASLIWPEMRGLFYYPAMRWPGMKLAQFQVDSSGMIALSRFVALCHSFLSPQGMFHNLTCVDPALARQRRVREFFAVVEKVILHYRQLPSANFISQMLNNYRNLGAFGSQTMFVDGMMDALGQPVPGWRYRSCPQNEVYKAENHQGQIDEVIRWFRLTARQVAQRWGEDSVPEPLRPDLKSGSENLHDFLHRVCPRADYEPGRIDERGKPYASYYVSIEGKALMQRGGYWCFPYATGRWSVAPGEVEGRGPAAFVLPTLKTLNNQKAALLEAAHLALRPPLLTGDDGLVDTFDRTAGAVNKGGVSPEGKPLIMPLPSGAIPVGVETMQMDQGIINDAFLVSFFQLLYDSAKMSPTEVVERVRQIALFLVPCLEPQNDQYLGPLVEREVALAAAQGLLPPLPPELKEAHDHYRVTFCSPIALMARTPQVSGIMQTLAGAQAIINISQDPSVLDPLNLSAAVRLMASVNAVPVEVLATPEEEQQKVKGRAANAERVQQMREAPARAAMMKAQAVVQKANAGVGTPGLASGVPQGEMPEIPAGGP